jgi:hypothetical protein
MTIVQEERDESSSPSSARPPLQESDQNQAIESETSSQRSISEIQIECLASVIGQPVVKRTQHLPVVKETEKENIISSSNMLNLLISQSDCRDPPADITISQR